MKDKTFIEVELEKLGEEKEDDLNNGNEGKLTEDKNLSITPSSCETKMIVNTIMVLRERNDYVFEVLLKNQDTYVSKMFQEMRSIKTLECLADKSLSKKPREDLVTKRIHMERYYIWAALLRFWHRLFLRLTKSKDKAEKEAYGTIAGLLYRLIFQKTYGATNQAFDHQERSCLKIIFCCRCRKKKYVKNLWDRIGVRPIAPYAKYDPSHNIWRNYQINERKDRRVFRSMDRIKLLNNIILDSFNIYELINSCVVESYFPLHDRYFLYSENKEPLFDEFSDIKNFIEPEQLRKKKEEIFDLLAGLEDQSDTSDFIKKPLNQVLSYQFYSPTEIDVEAIQNYYGEKIALYFEFLKFHTKKLYLIGIFGILSFVLDIILLNAVGLDLNPPAKYTPNKAGNVNVYDIHYWALVVYKLNRLVISVVTVIWSSFYLEYWKRKQQYFSIFYGMTEFENSENKRPNFKGDFVRNLASSAFNMLHYPPLKRLVKTVITYTVVFFIIIISIFVSLGCLAIKQTFDDTKPISAMLAYVLPAGLNFVALKIAEFFFYKVSVYFNMKENHETLTKFEDSLINKIFAFNFFNSFNSYFLIGFVQYIKRKTDSSYLSLVGKCLGVSKEFPEELYCYEEMVGQSWTFFVLTFIFNFFEILWPVLKKLFRSKFHGLPRKYQWGKVDEIIEKEYSRDQFQKTPEVDGVLFDYSEVTLQFSSLSFFGMLFPLSYMLSFFTSCFEIHLDKLYYMNYIRRPIPRSASDIGNWQYLLEAVSFFTIFINAGIIVFTAEGFKELNFIIFAGDNDKEIDPFSMQMKYFVFLVFLLLFIKLLIGVMVKDTPENLKIIMNRHKHIVGRTIKKPRESNANGKSGFPIQPLSNQVQQLTDNTHIGANENNKEENNPEVNKAQVAESQPPPIDIRTEINYKVEGNDFNVD